MILAIIQVLIGQHQIFIKTYVFEVCDIRQSTVRTRIGGGTE